MLKEKSLGFTGDGMFLGETGEDSHMHLLSPVISECINVSWTWTQVELPRAGRICTFTSCCLMRELEPETLTIHTPLCLAVSPVSWAPTSTQVS